MDFLIAFLIVWVSAASIVSVISAGNYYEESIYDDEFSISTFFKGPIQLIIDCYDWAEGVLNKAGTIITVVFVSILLLPGIILTYGVCLIILLISGFLTLFYRVFKKRKEGIDEN